MLVISRQHVEGVRKEDLKKYKSPEDILEAMVSPLV